MVEAMTSHNSYRLELGIDVALADIESNKGVIYDAHIVDLCVSLFREKTIRLLMRAECDRRAIQSGLWVSTVFARRFSGQLFKAGAEVVRGGVADLLTDHGNGIDTGQQQLFSPLDSLAGDVIGHIDLLILFEQPAQVRGMHVKLRGNAFQAQLGVMQLLVDIGPDARDQLLLVAFLRVVQIFDDACKKVHQEISNLGGTDAHPFL